MSLTLTLPPDLEDRFRAEAIREGVAIETLAARLLQEAELIRRIVGYFPADENRRVRSLAARQSAGTLTSSEATELTALAHSREDRNARRFADILALARLRGVPHRTVMTELGIRPARVM